MCFYPPSVDPWKETLVSHAAFFMDVLLCIERKETLVSNDAFFMDVLLCIEH